MPLLHFLLVALCFFVLPGLIFFRGIDGIIELKVAEKKQQAEIMLQNRLDRLEFFSSNDRLAHCLLDSFCENINQDGESREKIKKRINHLKSVFPNAFTFIIADSHGHLIRELSDQVSYAYLYRMAFNLLKSLKASSQKNDGNVALRDFETQINRLRPLLGALIRSRDLKMFFRNSTAGRSILASGASQRYHLWYGCREKFQVIVFLSRSFIKGEQGLRWATKALNKQRPEIVGGFSRFPPEPKTLFPELPEKLSRQTVVALGKNEKIFNPRQTGDQAIACRFLNQELRGFAFYQNPSQASTQTIRASIMAQMFKSLAIFLFVFAVFSLKNPIASSVKLKVSAFFAYAIFLPLIVIGSLTVQYVNQNELEILNNLKKEAFSTLEKLDAHYEWFVQERAQSLAQYFTKNVEPQPKIFQNTDSLKNLHRDLQNIANPGEIIITDRSSKDYLFNFSGKIVRDRIIYLNAATDLLKIFNSENLSAASAEIGFLPRLLHGDMYELQNRISSFALGEYELDIFYRLVNFTGRTDWGKMMAIIAWDRHQLQKEYVQKFCQSETYVGSGIQFAAFSRSNESLYLTPLLNHNKLINLMNLSINRQTIQSEIMKVNGKEHLVVVMLGRRLGTQILAAILPLENLRRNRSAKMEQAKWIALFLCLISISTMYMLRTWLFKPLEEIKTGLKAIAARDFRKRLNIVCYNEFGNLLEALNNSLETLQDLEVARIVQESILPEGQLSLNQVEIAAKTRTMTNLGGDYFDMYCLDDRKVLVFIGDATGHGIPAALNMAMVKAILIHENLRGLQNHTLMKQISRLFESLRSQGVKDFMTALCVEFDTISGHGQIINLGHCYPMLMKKNEGRVILLDHIRGLPPGFKRASETRPVDFKLDPGDRLVLFTDGFIECNDGHGKPIGFEGLADLISASGDDQVETHLSNVFSGLTEWSETLQDDCTMIIMRYK